MGSQPTPPLAGLLLRRPKVRLATAIREGAAVTRPLKSFFLEFGYHGDILSACTLGAAIVALHARGMVAPSAPSVLLEQAPDILTQAWPELGRPVPDGFLGSWSGLMVVPAPPAQLGGVEVTQTVEHIPSLLEAIATGNDRLNLSREELADALDACIELRGEGGGRA